MAAQAQPTTNAYGNTDYRAQLTSGSVIFAITNTVVQALMDTPKKAYMALTEPDLIIRPTRANKAGYRQFGISIPAGGGKEVMLGFVNFFAQAITDKSSEEDVIMAVRALKAELLCLHPDDVSVPATDQDTETALLALFTERELSTSATH
jgi:hypothetical protein